MKKVSFFALGAFLLAAGPLWADLRIAEICPEPAIPVLVTNRMDHATKMIVTTAHAPILDPNGKTSGWIKLYNDGNEEIDLSNFKISCKKRGKKLVLADVGSLCGRMVPAHGYTLVYIGEQYDNAEDMGGDGKTVKIYPNGVMAVPASAKPKNFPIVVLGTKDNKTLERFIVPVDLPQGYSFAPGKDSSDARVTRAVLPHPNPEGKNNYADAIPYGPGAGPLYEIKHKLTDLKPNPPAEPGKPYEIWMPVNPLPGPGEKGGNKIESVTLLYRVMVPTPGYKDQSKLHEPDFKGNSFVTNRINMVKDAKSDKSAGDIWRATIPAENLPEQGKLLQWAFLIKEQGTEKPWRFPAFLDPDLGYEWYGTITKPTDKQTSATLPTFHLFGSDKLFVKGPKGDNGRIYGPIDRQHEYVEAIACLTRNGPKDDDLQRNDEMFNRNLMGICPYGARCAVYDEQTSNYYDNVKIDLRGNTTAGVIKKSHGLRFNKCQPWNGVDAFTGEKLKDIRKTSFIAEYCDPTTIRQALSFQVWRQCGNLVPFDYPARLMMNGKFYQLAYHSNRFTGELLENYYDFEEKNGSIGYGYKNCGTLTAGNGSAAGAIEKKTPDDGHENDLSELAAFTESLSGSNGSETEKPELTQTVVRSFNLPAWINYLASARITQEADDIWANLCTYYDSVHTGTWMPLGYDQNLSFGQYYPEGCVAKVSGKPKGTIADWDNHKSHPFYGGFRVMHEGVQKDRGNHGFEMIYQSPKFRRLYLRRLRSLMDQILKEPGTSQENTPFWTDIVLPLKEKTTADAALDDDLWWNGRYETITIWEPQLTFEEGYADMWDNYIVKRRVHLFETHSIHNKSKPIGYGRDFNAGIPDAQSPISQLAPNIRFVELDNQDAIVIENKNNEAVDMSGWKLGGAWTNSWQIFPAKLNDPYALPPGTVVDGNDKLYIAFDRESFIAKKTLTDQVIIGNVPAPSKSRSLMTLSAADGTMVIGGNSGEGPTAIATPDGANGKAAVNETMKEPSMKEWLETISGNDDGRTALKAFNGSAEDLRICKMLGKLPIDRAGEKVSLRIEGLTPNATKGANGFTLNAKLSFDGQEVKGGIDGKIVLQEFSDLNGKPLETELTGKQFPLTISVGSAKTKFFRIVLKDL